MYRCMILGSVLTKDLAPLCLFVSGESHLHVLMMCQSCPENEPEGAPLARIANHLACDGPTAFTLLSWAHVNKRRGIALTEDHPELDIGGKISSERI